MNEESGKEAGLEGLWREGEMALEEVNSGVSFQPARVFSFSLPPPRPLLSGGRHSVILGSPASVMGAWNASQQIEWTPQTCFSSMNGGSLRDRMKTKSGKGRGWGGEEGKETANQLGTPF